MAESYCFLFIAHCAFIKLTDNSDPYVKLILHDKKELKTKVIKKSLNPRWEETFHMYDKPRCDLSQHFSVKAFRIRVILSYKFGIGTGLALMTSWVCTLLQQQ